ncbi:hypothetical protein ACHQM5_019997 [Ranunculus cassubicifolius]
MDFHSMKRKNLQALCKKHKIPANGTNVAMADQLTSLLKKPEGERKAKKVRFCLDDVNDEVIDLTKIEEKSEKIDLGKIKSSMKPGFERINQEIHEVPARSTRSRRASVAAVRVTQSPVQKRKRKRDEEGEGKEEVPIVLSSTPVEKAKPRRGKNVDGKKAGFGSNGEKEIDVGITKSLRSREPENDPRRRSRRVSKIVAFQPEERIRDDVMAAENVVVESVPENAVPKRTRRQSIVPAINMVSGLSKEQTMSKAKDLPRASRSKVSKKKQESSTDAKRQKVKESQFIVEEYPKRSKRISSRRESIALNSEVTVPAELTLSNSVAGEVAGEKKALDADASHSDGNLNVSDDPSLIVGSEEDMPGNVGLTDSLSALPHTISEETNDGNDLLQITADGNADLGEALEICAESSIGSDVERQNVSAEEDSKRSKDLSTWSDSIALEFQVEASTEVVHPVSVAGEVEVQTNAFDSDAVPTDGSSGVEPVSVAGEVEVQTNAFDSDTVPTDGSSGVEPVSVAGEVEVQTNAFDSDAVPTDGSSGVEPVSVAGEAEVQTNAFDSDAVPTDGSSGVEPVSVAGEVEVQTNAFDSDAVPTDGSSGVEPVSVAGEVEVQTNAFDSDAVPTDGSSGVEPVSRIQEATLERFTSPMFGCETIDGSQVLQRKDIVLENSTQVSLENNDNNLEQKNVNGICEVSQIEETVENTSDESAEGHISDEPPLLHSYRSDSGTLCQESSESTHLIQVEKVIIDDVATDCISEAVSIVLESSSCYTDLKAKDITEEVDLSCLSAKSLCDNDTSSQGHNEPKSSLSDYELNEKDTDELVPDDNNENSMISFEKSPEGSEYHAKGSNFTNNSIDLKGLLELGGVGTSQQNIEEVNDPTNQMVESEDVANGFQLCMKEPCNTGIVDAGRSPFFPSENQMESDLKGSGDAEFKFEDHVSEACIPEKAVFQETSETKPLKQVQKELVRLKKEGVLKMDWITDHVTEGCISNTSTLFEAKMIPGNISNSEVEDKMLSTSLCVQEEFSPTSNDYRNFAEVNEELHKVASDFDEMDEEVSFPGQIRIGEHVLEAKEDLQPSEKFHRISSEKAPLVQEEKGKSVSSLMEFFPKYTDVEIGKKVDVSLLFEKSTVEVDYPHDSACNTSVQGINEPCKVRKEDAKSSSLYSSESPWENDSSSPGDLVPKFNVCVAVGVEESKITEDSIDHKDFLDVESSDDTSQQNMEELDDPQNHMVERVEQQFSGFVDSSVCDFSSPGPGQLHNRDVSLEPDLEFGPIEAFVKPRGCEGSLCISAPFTGSVGLQRTETESGDCVCEEATNQTDGSHQNLIFQEGILPSVVSEKMGEGGEEDSTADDLGFGVNLEINEVTDSSVRQIATPASPQISREEAFAMLCRGSSSFSQGNQPSGSHVSIRGIYERCEVESENLGSSSSVCDFSSPAPGQLHNRDISLEPDLEFGPIEAFVKPRGCEGSLCISAPFTGSVGLQRTETEPGDCVCEEATNQTDGSHQNLIFQEGILPSVVSEKMGEGGEEDSTADDLGFSVNLEINEVTDSSVRQIATPASPQISREEAFAMLCRGSSSFSQGNQPSGSHVSIRGIYERCEVESENLGSSSSVCDFSSPAPGQLHNRDVSLEPDLEFGPIEAFVKPRGCEGSLCISAPFTGSVGLQRTETESGDCVCEEATNQTDGSHQNLIFQEGILPSVVSEKMGEGGEEDSTADDLGFGVNLEINEVTDSSVRQIATPASPQVSREEAFAMLCRGSSSFSQGNQPSGSHVSIRGIYERLCSSKSVLESGCSSQGAEEPTSSLPGYELSADDRMLTGNGFDQEDSEVIAISQKNVEKSSDQENDMIQYCEDKNCCSVSKAVSSENEFSELEISPATGTPAYAPVHLLENEVISQGNDESIDNRFSAWEISLFSKGNVENHNANTETSEADVNEISEKYDVLHRMPVSTPELCILQGSSINLTDSTPKRVTRRDAMDEINSNLRKMHISSALKEKRFSVIGTRLCILNDMKENVPNSTLKQSSGAPLMKQSVMKRRALEDVQNTTSKRANSTIC